MKTNIPIIIIVTILFSGLFLACKTLKQEQDIPICIQTKIMILKDQPVQNPPVQVWKWETKDNTFYYFNAACCDQFSSLLTSNCKIVCAPDGGITGKGDGKCPDFSTDMIRTLIWKDERKLIE